MSTFEEIPVSIYQNKGMGLAHQQEEYMQCDCNFNPGESHLSDSIVRLTGFSADCRFLHTAETDDPMYACGEGSGCINRLTQTECSAGDCRCQGHCQNQR